MTDRSTLPLQAGGAPRPAHIICGVPFRYFSKPECFPKYFRVWVIVLGVQKNHKANHMKTKTEGFRVPRKVHQLFIRPGIRRNCMDGEYEDTKK